MKKLHSLVLALLLLLGLFAAAWPAVDSGVCTAADQAGCTGTNIRVNANEELQALNGRAPLALTGVAGTNTITACTSPAIASYVDRQIFSLKPAANNTGATTLNLCSIAAKPVVSASGVALAASDLQSSSLYVVVWYAANDQFRVVTALGAGVTIANNSVTNGKLAQMPAATLKCNPTGVTANALDCTLGTNLSFAGTVLNASGGGGGGSPGGSPGQVQYNNAGAFAGFTASGDATINTGTGAVTIAANAVSNAKAAQMPANSLKGNNTGGLATAADLTATQATAMLDVVASGTKGLAPASGGGTVNFLRADGTWAAPGNVVGPASATDNAITRFDSTTGKVVQDSTVLVSDAGEVVLPLVATPAAPAADTLSVSAGKKGGRMLPKAIGPSGLDYFLQPLLASNKIAWWNPPGNATTVPAVVGMGAPTALGTATARTVATTNMATRAKRLGYVSAATAASLAGHYNPTALNQWTIGNGTNLGGFYYVMRFVPSDAATVSGARMFVGFRNATAAPTNVEPDTLTNAVGACQLSTLTTLSICYGGSAAQTSISLGASFPADTLSADLYELALFAPPGVQDIRYQVTRLNTGDVATGTLSGTVGTVIPFATTLMGPVAWRSNNATALAVGLDVVSVYIETDN